jgi:hypothetical protein
MSDDAILEKMSSAPFLIVTVHAFSEYAICKILDSRGLRTVFVSHSPYNDEEIASYGFQSPPLNILLTPKLFLELRATIRSGLSIVCDADFAAMGPGSARERFISLSIFEFKRLVGVDLYFACNRVRNNGVIECFIEKPDMSEKVSPNAVAARFIAFVDRVQGRSSNLRIGDWSRLTADRPHRYSAEKRVRKHRARKSAPN